MLKTTNVMKDTRNHEVIVLSNTVSQKNFRINKFQLNDSWDQDEVNWTINQGPSHIQIKHINPPPPKTKPTHYFV